MNILEQIIAEKRKAVALQKELATWAELERSERFATPCTSLRQALQTSDSGIIAEFKRKSPSKGWIFPEAKVEKIVPQYETHGATACSILTDEPFFGGSRQDFERARGLVRLPLLRKDFIVDEYQIVEAKAMGADVVLLIAAALTKVQTRVFAATAHALGMETLLEIHGEDELDYIDEYTNIVGINNRNLKTFEVSIDISLRLGEKISFEWMKISESGISEPATVRSLRQAGFQGFLMGENFMKTGEPAQALSNFIASV